MTTLQETVPTGVTMENKRISESLVDPETKSTIQGATRITGNISGPGDLVLDGELKGDIAIGGLLFIGEKGSVQGKAAAENMILAGHIAGRITVKERIEIRTSGHIEGHITCQKIAIAEGAYLDGEVHTHKGKVLAPDLFTEKRKGLQAGEK
jgi:cytoskeletal protein CcmA (bactofilin family)